MLILASSSPRRKELLERAGIEFLVKVTDVPEEHRMGESPADFARRLAEEKARGVARQHPQAFVLGADTIVVVGGTILGKPKDSDDAMAMLALLSGREHEVITAVSLNGPDGKVRTEAETTKVFFTELSMKDAERYVATNEPMDKAGAYAIQGLASRWVYKIEGDYYNVMGLPVARVWRMLVQAGAVDP